MIENDIKLLEHCVLDLQHRVQALEKKVKQTQRRVIVLECKAAHEAEQTEPQTIRCPKCGRSDYIREFGKDFSVTAEKAGFKYKCINCNTYIEPQSDRKTDNSSEKPNNCEHITEDGVTCAKYPACDDCLDNPLNKVKGSERLVKGKDEPQMGDAKPIPLSNRVTHIKDEPWTEMIKCYKCRWWNYSYGCGNPKGICEFEERYQVKRSE